MIKKQQLIFSHQLSIISAWFDKIRLFIIRQTDQRSEHMGGGGETDSGVWANAKLSPDVFKEKEEIRLTTPERGAAESAPAAGGF